MLCLVELVRLEYENLGFYFVKIADITAASTQSEDPKVGAQGIEFWTSLAEEEIYRLK